MTRIALTLAVVLTLAGCTGDTRGFTFENLSDVKVSIVSATTQGDVVIVTGIAPDGGAFLHGWPGTTCRDMTLIARGPDGSEVARRAGRTCLNDTWRITRHVPPTPAVPSASSPRLHPTSTAATFPPTATGSRLTPAPTYAFNAMLFVDVMSAREVHVVINGETVGEIDCGRGMTFEPGRFGVPPLPWQLQILADDGSVLLNRSVGSEDLPLFVIAFQGAVVVDHMPIPAPFVPCPTVPGGLGP